MDRGASTGGLWATWRTTIKPGGWPCVCLMAMAIGAVVFSGCGPPSTTAVQEDDPKLLQEVVRRQEGRVAEARAEVTKLERELRLVRMRLRMLECAGRHDLASAVAAEERGLRAQLTHALANVTDEDDALSIYRGSGNPS